MSHVVCMVYSLLSIIQNGETALMKASENGDTEVVKVLVEAKADLNITDQVNLIINYLLTLIWVCIMTIFSSHNNSLTCMYCNNIL